MLAAGSPLLSRVLHEHITGVGKILVCRRKLLKNYPQISGYVRLREEQSTLGERVNGRKPEDSAREGRGDGPQAQGTVKFGKYQAKKKYKNNDSMQKFVG